MKRTAHDLLPGDSLPEYGLYHSPAVNDADFDTGLRLYRTASRMGTVVDWPSFPCVCGDPSHRFVPGPDGWERSDSPAPVSCPVCYAETTGGICDYGRTAAALIQAKSRRKQHRSPSQG